MKRKKDYKVKKDWNLQVRFDLPTLQRIEKAVVKTNGETRTHIIRTGTKKYLDELGV